MATQCAPHERGGVSGGLLHQCHHPTVQLANQTSELMQPALLCCVVASHAVQMELQASAFGSEPLPSLVQKLAARREAERRQLMQSQTAAKGRGAVSSKAAVSQVERAHAESVLALKAVHGGRAVPHSAMQSSRSAMIRGVQEELRRVNLHTPSLPTFSALSAHDPIQDADELPGVPGQTALASNATAASSAASTKPKLLHEFYSVDTAVDPLNGLQFDTLAQLQAHAAAVGAADISLASTQHTAASRGPSSAAEAHEDEDSFEESLPPGRLAGRMHAAAGCAPGTPALLENFTAGDAAAGSGADSDSESDGNEAQTASTYMPWESRAARPPAAPGLHDWGLHARAAGPNAAQQEQAAHTEQDSGSDEEEIQVLDSAAFESSAHADGQEP